MTVLQRLTLHTKKMCPTLLPASRAFEFSLLLSERLCAQHVTFAKFQAMQAWHGPEVSESRTTCFLFGVASKQRRAGRQAG